MGYYDISLTFVVTINTDEAPIRQALAQCIGLIRAERLTHVLKLTVRNTRIITITSL